MHARIPGTLVGTGFLLDQITIIVKKVPTLQFLGRIDYFQWSLATLAAVTLSYGIFLSLCGLFRCPPTQRRTFAAIHVLGLFIYCWVVGILFSEYVQFSKINSMEFPSVLPKLIENSQKLETQAAREKMAQHAYEFYGTILVYPADNGQWVKYAPTEEDIAAYKKFAGYEALHRNMKETIIGGQLRQLPFLIAMNLGIFVLTFVVGTLWLTFRKSPTPSAIQS